MVDSETKTFTKKTELVFTTIEITDLQLPGNFPYRFEANFKYGLLKNNLEDKKTYGKTIENCIENVSKFLDCEIDERHYIIK